MKNLAVSSFTILYFLLNIVSSQDIPSSIDVDILKYEIPCPLKWAKFQKGHPLPSYAVSLNSLQHSSLVARATILGQVLPGNLTNDGFCYFYSSKSGATLKESKCEVLTNPNNCSLYWEASPLEPKRNRLHPALPFVTLDETIGGLFIGRVETGRNVFQVCKFFKNKQKCSDIQKLKYVESSFFEILKSVTPILSNVINHLFVSEKAHINDVHLDGKDTILNRAEADITSSISYGVSSSVGSGTDNSRVITAGRPEANVATTTGDSTDNDQSEDLDVSRDITVPAFTSIESCIIQSIPSLTISFSANVTFFAEGVNSDIIEEILKLENFSGPFHTNGKSVQTIAQGEVKDVQGQISSKFQINPINVLDELSCNTLAKKLDVEQRQVILNQVIAKGNVGGQNALNYVIMKAYQTYGSWLDF